MGVDFLDIEIRIEDKFGIKLSPDDVDAIACDRDILAGSLYDLILKKLQLRDRGRYEIGLNRRLWMDVQRLIISVTDVPLDGIELKTPLKQLFPKRTRREAWARLREACPYHVLELEYPSFVRPAGLTLAALMAAFEQFHVWQIQWAPWLWPAVGIVGIWMVTETYAKILLMCAPWQAAFPSRVHTVKDLCRAILAVNYAVMIAKEVSARNDTQWITVCEPAAVWQQLTELLAEVLGVRSERIIFSSKLIRDLGMA